MNKTILFTLFLIASQTVSGQHIRSKIDSLNSNAAVEKLIRSFDKDYQQFSLKPITEFNGLFGKNDFCKNIADSLKITRAFYKADFDKNGYTDLLAIGEYYNFHIVVVMNYGNDSLQFNNLTRRTFQYCTFPKMLNDSVIRYYYFAEPDWRKKETKFSLQYSDLIFKYGDFIEYNPQPADLAIEKIEYQTTMCYGTCPQFYISVESDRSAVFKAQAYNRQNRGSKEIKGTFKTILSSDAFEEITGLVNYLNIPGLKDDYEVNWTDDQTCTLTITYNGGKVKTISDYGLIGTFGLDRLYKLLFALRFNQRWE